MLDNKYLEELSKLIYGDQVDAFSPNGVVQAATKLQQKPNTLENQINLMNLASLESQRKGISDLESRLANTKKDNTPLLAALAGASDIFSGTNKLSQVMQQKEQEDAMGLRNAMMLQNMKKDLSKEEISNLSSQLKDQREAQKLDMMLKAQEKKDQLENQRLQMLMGSQNKKDDNKNFQKENSLFTVWSNNPTTKSSQEVATAYEKVTSAAKTPTAAGDLSLIFGYMKMLDPGSVVREGEFATAQNATGVPDRVKNMYNNIISGQRLNPAQREDFSKQANSVYSAQLEQQKRWDNTIKSRAEKLGLDPSKVVLGETLFGPAYSSQSTPTSPSSDLEAKRLRYEELKKKALEGK